MLDLHLQASSDMQYGVHLGNSFSCKAAHQGRGTAGASRCSPSLRFVQSAGHVQMDLPQGAALGDMGSWTAAVAESTEQQPVTLLPGTTPASKICRMCTLEKPASEFKRARSHDGLMHICTLCMQASSSAVMDVYVQLQDVC